MLWACAAPDATKPIAFLSGDRVMIYGLSSKPELNGKTGQVTIQSRYRAVKPVQSQYLIENGA